MTSLDDLRDSLERYSERGTPRGPGAVLADAQQPPMDGHEPRGRYRSIAVLAAAAVVAVTILVLVRQHSESLDVVTTPSPPGSTSTVPRAATSIPPLAVPDGHVRLVKAGFGRIWIATLDESTGPPQSRLRSFDPTNGQLKSDAAIVGDVYAFGLTDHYVWVRTSTGGPASFPVGTGGQGDNAIYQVDPGSGTASPMRYLNGDGPLATSGTRVAAADFSHVEIVDESGQQTATASIDEAAGVTNATFPGTNGVVWLSYGPAGLYALHQGRHELIQLDPGTAGHVATHHLDDDLVDKKVDFGPVLVVGTRIWIDVQPSGLIAVDLPLTSSVRAPVAPIPLPPRVQDMERVNDHQFVVRSLAAVELVETSSPETPIETQLEPIRLGEVVILDGKAWAAQWNDLQTPAATTVSFTRVVTSAPSSAAGTTSTAAGTTSRPIGPNNTDSTNSSGNNTVVSLTHTPTSTAAPGETGTDDLVTRLSGSGATVARNGTSPGSPFQVEAQLLCADGQRLRVYEFTDRAAQEAASAGISDDGSRVETRSATLGDTTSAAMVEWIGTPHFFAQGRIIVLDLNGNAQLLSRLTDVLGPTISPHAPAGVSIAEPC